MSTERRIHSIPAALASLVRDGDWVTVGDVRRTGTVVGLHRLEASTGWNVRRSDVIVVCWEGEFAVELNWTERAYLMPGELFLIGSGIRHRFVAGSPAYALTIGQGGPLGGDIS